MKTPDALTVAVMRRVTGDLQRLHKTLTAHRLQLIQVKGQLFLQCQMTGVCSPVELSEHSEPSNLQAQEWVE